LNLRDAAVVLGARDQAVPQGIVERFDAFVSFAR
jgi:hypothetical protein